jgi:hypothetical protein
VPHRGQPEVFNFDFELMVPRITAAKASMEGRQPAMDRSAAAAA